MLSTKSEIKPNFNIIGRIAALYYWSCWSGDIRILPRVAILNATDSVILECLTIRNLPLRTSPLTPYGLPAWHIDTFLSSLYKHWAEKWDCRMETMKLKMCSKLKFPESVTILGKSIQIPTLMWGLIKHIKIASIKSSLKSIRLTNQK